MPDFTPNYMSHSEIIGDSSSSEYNLNFPLASLPVQNSSTNIVSKTIIQILEFFLMIVLLPFTACQRAYENDHLMVMLQVIIEVSLELIMWLILAGVSILTSAALIFDDLYCGKSGSDGYRRLVKNYTDQTIRHDDRSQLNSTVQEDNLSTENEWPEETVIRSLADINQKWLSSPFPENEIQPFKKRSSKLVSYAPEKDDESVNFSFYKPRKSGFTIESDSKNKK